MYSQTRSAQKLTVNYDQIAPHYDVRYGVNSLPGIAGLLRQTASDVGRPAGRGQGLEVGCGTGHWLGVLAPHTRQIFGLDLSAGMLRQARRQAPASPLAQGQAGQLPFASASFDLLICVNALHHFPNPRAFIAESRRLLRPGGAWVNIGMDPHAGRDHWYLYDYFPGTLATDRQRFPSVGTLMDWVRAAGFERAAWLTPERISNTQRGRAVLDDPFLQQHGTSQLALLSDEAYQAGLARLRQALDAAEAAGEGLEFVSEIWMSAVVARVPG
jgi:ubiquinone/menaquinone biosynthesis C-methylase UbiE